MLATSLTLQSDLGIESVEQLHQELLPYIEHDRPIVLLAGAVQRVHTASLQLLHAFVVERAGKNMATTIESASDILYSAARELALCAAMGIAKNTNGETP